MSGRAFAVLLTGAVLLFLLATLGLAWSDPSAVIARQQAAALGMAQQRELAPFWLTVKQVALVAAGAVAVGLGVAGLGFCIGVALKFVAWGLHWLLVGIWNVYPKDGSLPAVAGGHVLDASHLDAQAMRNHALVHGVVTRLPAAAVKPPALPEYDAPLMIEPGASLPERIDVFNAPRLATPSLLLGMGENGPITLELGDAGHVLIGGSPRRGKTTLIASIIAALAQQDPTGRIAQVALSDLKRMDFALLPPDLALLRGPVAYSPDETMQMLTDAETEMDARMTAFSGAGVKNLNQWNRGRGAHCPYLIIIVDEVAELTTHRDTAKREQFIKLIQRLGSLGGAAGIIEILATQRPSADVLPKQITGIADTRIAFKTATPIESRLILDDGGAASLPDIRGRCLIRRDALYPAQAYYSGLSDGRFDKFMFSLPRRTPAGLLAAEQRLGLSMASGNGHEKPAALIEADAVVIDGLTSLGYSATEAKRAVQYLPDDVPDIEDRLRLAIASFAGTPYTVQPVREAVQEAVQEAVYRSETPVLPGNGTPRAGIPPSVPQDVPPSAEVDKLTIWRTWKKNRGSLSATEAELYKREDGVTGQKGGIKFYWVRSAVAEMEARRGRKLQE
jgi:hypothetical protein